MIINNWTTGLEGQKVIREFKVMGKPLFTPNAK
jgi:ABC-type tungstate transport system permease subunit